MTVNCREVQDWLQSTYQGETACAEASAAVVQTQQFERHIESCSACSQLVEVPNLPPALPAGSFEAADGGASPLLWQGMDTALERESHWSRAPRNASTSLRRTVVACGFAALTLFVILTTRRVNMEFLPKARYFSELAVGSLLFIGSLLLSIRTFQNADNPRPARWLLGAAVAFSLSALLFPEVLFPEVLVPEVLVPEVLVPEVLVPEVLLPGVQSIGQQGVASSRQPSLHPANWPSAGSCWAWGTSLAIVSMGWLLLFMRGRGTAKRRLSELPLTLLATGTLAADILLRLHCPHVDHRHLALGHGSIAVTLLVAAWLLRLSLKPQEDTTRTTV